MYAKWRIAENASTVVNTSKDISDPSIRTRSVSVVDSLFLLLDMLNASFFIAFACPYPACDKFFNRHDNLLQHLKVHKDYPSPHDQPDAGTISSPVMMERSPPTFIPRPAADTSSYYHTPSQYATNMAVSSLRTELPIPPPDTSPHSPAYDTTGQLYYRHNDDCLYSESRTLSYRTQPFPHS